MSAAPNWSACNQESRDKRHFKRENGVTRAGTWKPPALWARRRARLRAANGVRLRKSP